jgi:manganese/zinc/iron transport system permease protein
MSPQIVIQITAVLAAVSCALVGAFLVLKKMALMSDAISHAVLLGIVLGFFVTGNLTSPLLFVGATLMGVLLVYGVETLKNTKLVKEDAAIGLIFPALFSLGIILISKYAGNIHLDTDAVLLGEIAFAPFDRIAFFGMGIPRSFLILGSILLLNVTFVLLLYKELQITTFDPAFSSLLGISSTMMSYLLLTLVSITSVGAFHAVGAVLVVALMIAPAGSAFLITKRLPAFLWASIFFAILSALLGYHVAHFFNISIAGSIATVTGFIFVLLFCFAPEKGYFPQRLKRYEQEQDFFESIFLVHILNHENTPEFRIECDIDHVYEHLNWTPERTTKVIKRSQKKKLITQKERFLFLTPRGKKRAQEVMMA